MSEETAVELAVDLETADVLTRVPTIVIEELYVEVGARDSSTEIARTYEALVASKPVVPLDEKISRRAGTLEGQHLSDDPKPDLGPADSIVAATGLVHDEAVVTNDRDFETVDGLTVETY